MSSPSNNNPEISITACQRCRDSKLKCSREHPSCTRCQRAKANCVYPSPPDRKRLRQERNSPRSERATASKRQKSNLSRSAGDTSPSSENRSQVSARRVLGQEADAQPPTTPITYLPRVSGGEHSTRALNARENSLNSHSLSANPVHLPSESYPNQLRNADIEASEVEVVRDENSALPSRAVGLSLLEIYFTRAYNASLLFCKPLLFQEYLEGKVPTPLLKAIFALAALFLTPENDHRNVSPELSELKSLTIFHSRSLPWAKAAMKEVMVLIVEQPSLAAAQTLECVGLYWFGFGDYKRGDLCLSLAYRCCAILGYNSKMATALGKHDLTLDSELNRRCSWACWASMCIAAQPEAYVRSAWLEMAMVPLPAIIKSANSSWEVIPLEKMDQEWSGISISSESEVDTPPPIEAALVKILGVWAKVQLFVDDCLSYSSNQKIEKLSGLSQMLKAVYDSTTPTRTYMKTMTASDYAHRILTFDAIYHLSQVTLHSTVVPLFSGSPVDPTKDPGTVRTSAKEVMHHADSFASLLTSYLEGESDITYLSPLVAYGAFATAVVFLAFEKSCQDKSSASFAIEGYTGSSNRVSTVKAIVEMLDSLRVYWRVLQRPWERLSFALKSGFSSSLDDVNFQPRTEARGSLDDYGPSPTQENSYMQQPILHDRLSSDLGTLESSLYQPMEESTVTTRDIQTPINNLSTGPIDILDDDWWNMSLAATDNGYLVDFQPPNFFRQGWNYF
ncbi:hypothetical protein ASPWEDRAFT_31144 [Aspergillus wentii DTO 134E9]|uniref:Zn(2)-C6 fungal-type domain-containing protein n=1 Tax=Aspergillus wentii DTO 134E9 TaxID=1073089 RepID=A0A1L9RBA6_ASPWE|nr:uncharacterized protein ASPWEDRAFT_31144 [Aspergillus wentii DTO 134E9]KAI9934784.1 hypothetical protein MW887_000401 [Aspergillus wentii]OJJ32212.1 hypothetical protein ASPWEDRAFT_31144 [Aspergillus wentii DTO 134E9]